MNGLNRVAAVVLVLVGMSWPTQTRAAPLQEDSDEFPIIMMSAELGTHAEVALLGVDFIHTYNYPSSSYFNSAAANGLRVMVDLDGANWAGKPDGVAHIQSLVQSYKDHPAMGFWYLSDEPDPAGVSVSDLTELYLAIKAITPEIPVANAEAWTANWDDYQGAQDMLMIDHYPVRTTDPFPMQDITIPMDFLTMALGLDDEPVIPILQSFDWRVYYPDTPSRFPVAEELRYWCYASIALGARGLGWYGYYQGLQFAGGAQWFANTFAPVLQEVRLFVDSVAPAHHPTAIPGAAAANIYLATWNRSGVTWVVIVNDLGSSNTVSLSLDGQVADGTLTPWGSSAAIPATVSGGNLQPVTLDPYEVRIWTIVSSGPHTCGELSGSCCAIGQSCQGNSIAGASDCPGQCCSGSCVDQSGPVILSAEAIDITETSAHIHFIFNQHAQGQIEYGLDQSYGHLTGKEESFDFADHTQPITTLTPATTYHYRVHGWDNDGVEVVSDDLEFTTLGDAIEVDAAPAPALPDSSPTHNLSGGMPGCGCHSGSRNSSPMSLVLVLAAVLLTLGRRRRLRAWFGRLGLVVALLVLAPASLRAAPAGGVGNDWVRSHPFTLMGTSIHADSLDAAEYLAAGLNVLLAFAETTPQTSTAAAGGLPWHVHIAPADQGPDAWVQSLVTGASANAGGEGWILHDEPSRLQMPGINTTATWLRGQSPDTLVYGNLFPSYASAVQLYGDASNPGYSWPAYLDDFISIVGPDILMYDFYPFETDGDTKGTFFSDLMVARAKALGANLPYFTFLQAWANASVDMRMPSESDLRMQTFSHLAAGYSGLAYFIYDFHVGSGGLLDASGDPLPLYATAATLNAEVLNLGYCLRYLTSTDVRFLPGQYLMYDVVLTDNPLPDGLSAWSSGAGGDPHIVGADVDSSSSANQGEDKSGLLGFFTDDEGKHYFLLVNLAHGASQSAADATLPLWVQFDSSVNTLLELDRDSGETRTINLTDHRLEVTLLGGSGRLYKYDDGPFAPDTGPGPGPDAGVFDAGISADGGLPGDANVNAQVDAGSGMDDVDGSGCGCHHSGAGSGSSPLPLGSALPIFLALLWLVRRPGDPCHTE